MTCGLLGANDSAPIVKVGAESAMGRQEVPASRLSHSPPLPTPASQWAASVGSTARAATRPEFGLLRSGTPWYKGAGPILVHTGDAPEVPTVMVMVFEAPVEAPSVTKTVKVKTPGVKGVPTISPVGSSTKPSGR